jgi:hypothetical protein
VQVQYGPNIWRTLALIDTGAHITVFDYGTAEALLVRIGNAGAKTGFVALLGARRPVQFEYIDLSLVDDPAVSWTAEVAFITDKSFVCPSRDYWAPTGFSTNSP